MLPVGVFFRASLMRESEKIPVPAFAVFGHRGDALSEPEFLPPHVRRQFGRPPFARRAVSRIRQARREIRRNTPNASTASIDPFGPPSPNHRRRFAERCASMLPARIAIVVYIRYDSRRYGTGKSLPAPRGIVLLRRRNGVTRPMERPGSEGLGGFWPIEHRMSG